LRALEESLGAKYATRDIRALAEPFEALTDDSPFWNHRTEGLAILSAGPVFRAFDLQHSVKDLLVVADSLLVKPLLRNVQSAHRFQILRLGLHG